MDDKEKVELIKRTHEVVRDGYGGVMPGTGTIVDRREHPEAIPIPKNTMMGVPEPKPLPEGL